MEWDPREASASGMAPRRPLGPVLEQEGPILALAPMQAVTDLPFWRILSRYGGPDLYWTEYFRITPTWRPERWILGSLVRNPTGRPAVAQLIGNDPDAMARAVTTLASYPVAAIDLNLGCPAPIVYRKCAGGGLLRDLDRTERLVARLREETAKVGLPFTVKTRLGFDSADSWADLLQRLARHPLDLLTVHGRTVAGMYRSAVDYDRIRQAVETVPFPVLANGDVDSPGRARSVLRDTGARGVMIGRGCIRNPWIFQQIRDDQMGREPRRPTGREVLGYIESLWTETEPPDSRERLQVEHMKRYMNFIGLGLGQDEAASAAFLHEVRRATTREAFFGICREYLEHDDPEELVPHAGRGLPDSGNRGRKQVPEGSGTPA
jgi:tRNA-dihydrouridine synthase B